MMFLNVSARDNSALIKHLEYRGKHMPKIVKVCTGGETLPYELLYNAPEQMVKDFVQTLAFGVSIKFPKKYEAYPLDENGEPYGDCDGHTIKRRYTYFEDGQGGYNCAWIVYDSEMDTFDMDFETPFFKRGNLILNCPEDPSGKHEYIMPTESCIINTRIEFYSGLEENAKRHKILFINFLYLNKMHRSFSGNFWENYYNFIDPVTHEEGNDYLTNRQRIELLGDRSDGIDDY